MGRCDITTKLPLPPLVVQENVSEPPIFVAVVTIAVGAGGMLGKVTPGPLSWKLSNNASRVAVLNAACAMPTCNFTPTQSERIATPPGVAPLVICTHESPELVFQ